MPVFIVVHPHSFDDGLLEDKLPSIVKRTSIPTYFVPDGDKRPYGGSKIYDGVLVPDKERKLGKHGRAPLRRNEAKEILEKNTRIYLGGGNLSECLASSYNSLVRVAEEFGLNAEVSMVEDLIYLQAKKSESVYTLEKLVKDVPNYLESYLETYNETRLLNNELTKSSELL